VPAGHDKVARGLEHAVSEHLFTFEVPLRSPDGRDLGVHRVTKRVTIPDARKLDECTASDEELSASALLPIRVDFTVNGRVYEREEQLPLVQSLGRQVTFRSKEPITVEPSEVTFVQTKRSSDGVLEGTIQEHYRL
jgi:hypothetical protein